VHKQKSKRLI